MTKEQFKRVLGALEKSTDTRNLEGEGDYDDERGVSIEEINEEVDFDLGDEVHVRADVSTKGDRKGDEEGYLTPPSCETEWEELEYENLEVWVDEDEVEMTEEQEVKIWLELKKKITF